LDDKASLSGGCFCGALRYTIEPGEADVVNCHCTMCRRTSGAPFVTWILLSEDQFRLTDGSPATLKSSASAARWFCGNCGTPVAFRSDKRPGKVDVTVASLDDPGAFPPAKGVYVDSKLNWVTDK
jgi:hypothetical protein